MKNFLLAVITFLLGFIIVYGFYYFTTLKKLKKKRSITKKDINVEAKLFIGLNNIDMSTINCYKLNKTLCLFNAIIIALSLVVSTITDVLILKFLIALVFIFVMLYFTYKLYKKERKNLNV